MIFIVLLFVILVGGGWLIGRLLGNTFFPKTDNFDYNLKVKESPTVINNIVYKTENHLHISKDELEKITKKQ